MVLDECEGDTSRDPLSDLNAFLDAQRNGSGCLEGELPGEGLEHDTAAMGAAGLGEDDALPDGQLPLLLGTTAEPYCPGELLAKASLFGGSAGGGSSSSSQAAPLPPPLPGFSGCSNSATAGAGYVLMAEPASARPVGAGAPCFPPAAVPDAAAVAAAAAAAGEPLAVALPGSPDQCPRGVPTVGSAGHQFRLCKPCAFVNTKGCKDGASCKFCHLCGPGEKKRRKKEKSAFWRTVNRWQRSDSAQWP